MLNKILHFAAESLSSHWHVIFMTCLILLLITFFLTVRQYSRRSSKKDRGYENSPRARTKTVPDSLRLLPAETYRIFQDLYVPRLDGKGVTRIAYVVAARHGIFVVHPQRETGVISGTATDRQWSSLNLGIETTFTNPVIRNAYHARALARYLNLPEALICPVVVFDQEVKFVTNPPAHVLTSGLRRFILSYQAELLSVEMLDPLLRNLHRAATNEEARAEYDSYRRSKTKRTRKPRQGV
jgi:hypothetical protein